MSVAASANSSFGRILILLGTGITGDHVAPWVVDTKSADAERAHTLLLLTAMAVTCAPRLTNWKFAPSEVRTTIPSLTPMKRRSLSSNATVVTCDERAPRLFGLSTCDHRVPPLVVSHNP